MKRLTPADDFATRPIALPAAAQAPVPAVADAGPTCVEHGWVTASRHATSLGTIIYSACASCGTHRAELLESRAFFPTPISHAVGVRSADRS
ncbi:MULTISPECIES: hypothetical protein [unclassified Pseudoclavibacter]|uniref:hypothetical protein n=1 Tax=unclassified Pseudoclavibacter TaxID=2615177 RepID=UPI000CE75C12|nr:MULTISPECIES: hypothetical protein [unclassified Pseudoclavibacter]PPF35309.1 hypothetical protein C5E05_13100 [Pseudoclavibacter sp. AY1H1]PPF78091.1 hypothetical protein C5B99_01945 [Pseudoclavibacter sp. Z016]